MNVTTVCSAHPVVRVGVQAPEPLYGLSPRRWAAPAFALDSLELRPSLGLLEDEKAATDDFDGSAPGVLAGFERLQLPPGGV